MATEEQKLADRIRQFCLDHEYPVWLFCADCLNNSTFVRRLELGGSPTLRTVQRIDKFMKRHEQRASSPRRDAKL